jgi:hypothetical protein
MSKWEMIGLPRSHGLGPRYTGARGPGEPDERAISPRFHLVSAPPIFFLSFSLQTTLTTCVMPLTTKEVLCATAVAGTAAYVLKRLRDPPTPRLPPGPTWFPVIGHLLSMPRGSEHIAYTKMGKDLNSMLFLRALPSFY